MLTKNQIAADIQDDTGIKASEVKTVLDSLAELAATEIEAGEDFTIPGTVRIAYVYRAPKKKGERWKKGETITGIGGVERVAEEDSPPVAEGIRIKANPTGALSKLKPGAKPEDQKAFFKSTAGKNVRSRKAK